MRMALIDGQGLVLNVIEIEPDANWPAPVGCSLIDAGAGSPGDTWDGEKFIKPIPPEPEPVRDLEKEIDGLKARIDNIKELRQ